VPAPHLTRKERENEEEEYERNRKNEKSIVFGTLKNILY